MADETKDERISVLLEALEEIAHNHKAHSELFNRFPSGPPWKAASITLSWAQGIATSALAADAEKR